MIVAAWVCLLSPLVAVLVITLGGMRVPPRLTGWIATASTTVAFAGAVVALATVRKVRHEPVLASEAA